jgi:NitT/TauT family transport system substrate-binding protein
MRLSIRQLFSFFACLLVTSVYLAGCGGASTGASNDMTLKVAEVTNNIPAFQFYVALKEGFFKSQGLTLDPATPPVLNSGSKLSTAVETNSVEIGVGGTTDAFTISRIDSSIRMIADISNGLQIDVIASKNLIQQTHITDASSLADKVNALKGKKVGVSAPNSASDALVTYLFRQQGLNAQTDVTKVSVGASSSAALAALQSGRVDAVAIGKPTGEQAVAKGYGDILISPVRGDDPALAGQLFEVAYAKQSVINAKPKAIQAFIRGLAQADTFIQQQPDKTLSLLKTYLKSASTSVVNNSDNSLKVSTPKTPQICQSGYNVANQYHLKAGLIAVPLAYNNLVDENTINQAIGTSANC